MYYIVNYIWREKEFQLREDFRQLREDFRDACRESEKKRARVEPRVGPDANGVQLLRLGEGRVKPGVSRVCWKQRCVHHASLHADGLARDRLMPLSDLSSKYIHIYIYIYTTYIYIYIHVYYIYTCIYIYMYIRPSSTGTKFSVKVIKAIIIICVCAREGGWGRWAIYLGYLSIHRMLMLHYHTATMPACCQGASPDPLLAARSSAGLHPCRAHLYIHTFPHV